MREISVSPFCLLPVSFHAYYETKQIDLLPFYKIVNINETKRNFVSFNVLKRDGDSPTMDISNLT